MNQLKEENDEIFKEIRAMRQEIDDLQAEKQQNQDEINELCNKQEAF